MFQLIKANLQKPGRRSLLSLVLVISLGPGCGTWIGNPPKDTPQPASGRIALAIAGTTTALRTAATIPVIGKAGEVAGTFELTEARISLRDIRLKLDAADQSERETFEGPYIADLVANTVTPSLSNITLPVGTYRHLSLRMHKLAKDDIGDLADDDLLVDQSLVMKGVYTPAQGQAIQLTIKLDASEEFTVQMPDPSNAGVDVKEGLSHQVIVAFRVNEWFDFQAQDHDLSDLSGSEVVIDDRADDVGSKLLDRIKNLVKDSARFGEDKDGDGQLSRSEGNE